MAELNNVLYRQLNREEVFPPPSKGVEIRRARPDEAERWANVIGTAFREGEPCPPDFVAMFTPLFEIERSVPFFATVDGNVAGGGGGLIIDEHKLIALSGAATLPQFRGRGVQTAVLHARLKLAAEEGCDLAVTVTRGGTTSQRNAERLGFRVAYSKATVIKEVKRV